jgi:hypothetical protein
MSVRNSSRVFCCVRKQPSIHEVVVIEPGFCTPRIVMHKWLYTGTAGKARDVSEGAVEHSVGLDVRCLHDYCDTSRLDSLLHAKGDLFCKALLDLETAAEGFSNACEFRNAQNELVRDVRYGNLRAG